MTRRATLRLCALECRAVPASFLVTNTADAGPGSLRDVLLHANATPGLDDVTFYPPAFSTPKTIVLTSADVLIADAVTITGPAARVTIDANLGSRIFKVDVPGKVGQLVAIDNLTLTRGMSKSHPTQENGGAILNLDETLTLSNVTIADSVAGGHGGAVAVFSPGSVTATDCVLTGNSADGTYGSGGAVFGRYGPSVSLTRCVLSSNSANDEGGAVGFWSGGKLTMSDCTLDDNYVSNTYSSGGAVSMDSGSVTVTRCALTNNLSHRSGGAIYAGTKSTLTISDSTLSGNYSNLFGGAVHLYSAVGALINCTLSGNQAAYYGGASYLKNSSLNASNCTFSSNSATVGGAMYMYNGSIDLVQGTVAFNSTSPSGGGGLAAYYGSVTLSSTVVAKNTGSTLPNFVGNATITANNSLLGSTDGANVTGNGNLVSLDPKLAALADNGGATRTHALLPQSPCVNAGSNVSNSLTDQRGLARVFGSAADIGAFELQPLRVTAVQINDGSVQRSMVTKLTVQFSEPPSFPSSIGAGFVVSRTGPGGPLGVVNTTAVQSGTTVRLTFADGGPVGVAPTNSLIDGKYALQVVSANVHATGGALDGDNNGVAGGNHVTAFHRLFGDSDGDGSVNVTDFAAFRNALGNAAEVATFDSDGDGDVDAYDFYEFRRRFRS